MNIDLSKAKLRKVETKEAPAVAVEPALCASSDDYNRLMEETFMEEFYPAIQQFSFGSVFRPLSIATAAAIVAAHERFRKDPASSTHFLREPDGELARLAHVIDQAKAEQGWSHVFVRLSSRSPKDAALSAPKFEALMRQELESLEEEEKDVEGSSEQNRRLHALYRASTSALKTESGAEAVRLLIESDRIQGDLKEYVEGITTKPFSVVIREFRDFPVQYEFRGFVYDRKLTALTQYNEFCFFPGLVAEKDAVAAKITREFERMIEAIELPSYVVDFVLCPLTPAERLRQAEDEGGDTADPLAGFEVAIVELNPFAEFAGSGLFSWIHDKPLLFGRKPFEFRIVEALPDFRQCLANMAPQWRKFVVTGARDEKN